MSGETANSAASAEKSATSARRAIGAAHRARISLALVWLTMILGAQSQPTSAPSAYAGSEACRACHATQYTAWKRSLHVQMTKPIDQATVEGDFQQSAPFTQHGRTFAVSATGGHYAVSVTRPSAGGETFPVATRSARSGSRAISRSCRTAASTCCQLFWNTAWQRWLDWKEIVPVPDGNRDLRQIWNVKLLQLPRDQHPAQLRRRDEGVQHDLDRDGDRLRVVPRPRRRPTPPPALAYRVDEARDAAPGVRHVRLLPRQQDELLRRLHARRSAGRFRRTRAHQRSDPRERSAGRVSGPMGGRAASTVRRRSRSPVAFAPARSPATAGHVAHGSANAHSLKVPIEQSDRLVHAVP